MEISIGIHFASNSQAFNGAMLKAIEALGLGYQGGCELIDSEEGKDLVLVWTTGTIEQFRAASDMLVSLNNSGPVMMTVDSLTTEQTALAVTVLKALKLDFHDDAIEDNELFVYVEKGVDIRNVLQLVK